MGYFLKCVLTVIVGSLLSINAFGQINAKGQKKGLNPNRALSQFQINEWASDQGLPTQGVNGIVQNNEGYILLTTYEGLFKFDGIAFKSILPNDTVKNFSINSFKRIYKAPSGTLWMAANGGGLASYSKNAWKFFTKRHGLPSNVVNCFVKSVENELWVGTSDGVVVKKGDNFEQITVSAHLKNIPINDIISDLSGNLWFATSKGLIKTDSKGLFIKSFTTKDGLGSNNVLTLHAAANNDIWIGTEKGLRLLKREVIDESSQDKGIEKESIMLLGVADILRDKSVYKIFQDQRNNVWIGTNRGLFRYNDQNIGIESIVDNSSLPLHQVTDIAQDNQGNIWVGTYRNGFYQIVQGKFITYSKAQGITGKTVYSVVEIKKDSFLIATNNGVTQYNQEWKFNPLKIKNELFLENQDVRDICIDSNNNIWFATTNKLYLVTAEQEIKSFSTKDGLLSNYVRMVYQDSQGNIWIGTDEGLNKYSNNSFESITIKDGLSNNRVHSVFEDREGVIWVCTEDGLNKYANGTFEKFYIEDGLAGNVIFKIYEDEEGVLWVGTNGGITRIKEGEISSINSKDGLHINSIFDILEDKKGFFWIPNNQGIYRIAKEQLKQIANGQQLTLNAVMYKKGDGMMVNACTANARSLITSRGEYWIPTPEGVTVIPKPEVPDINNIPPKIIIESVHLNGEEIPFKDPLVVPAGEHQLRIKFTGLDYRAPERVSFSYALGDFINMTPRNSNREAVFTNIPHGSYTFSIVAFNSDNVQSSLSFQIIQEAKIYEKTWFRFLLLIFLVLAVWVIVRSFLSREKRKNKVLEEKVKARTLEIEDQKKFIEEKKREVENKNQSLEETNEKLIRINKEKNQLIGIVAHDLKSPLNHITGLINIIKLSDDNLNEEQNQYIKHILDSTQRLNEMITHILDVEAVESGNLKINPSNIELFAILERIIVHHHTDIERKNMELVFDHNGLKFPIRADEKIVTQIFDNLISNAIKFTPVGKKIFVSIGETKGENVRVEIKDQGPGISVADMHKLFGKYQKLSARPTGGENSTGLGLSIVKKYVEALGGKVWCESEIGKGANFIVELKKISDEKYTIKEDYLLDR